MSTNAYPETPYERLCCVTSTLEMLADTLLDTAADNNAANVLRLVVKELDEIRAIVSDAEDKATNAEAAE